MKLSKLAISKLRDDFCVSMLPFLEPKVMLGELEGKMVEYSDTI